MIENISVIEELTLEAEISVLSALCECYEKQALILEYSTSEDVSEFSVFQEGKFGQFLDKVDSKLQKTDGESIIKKILLFIPRILMKMINIIRDKRNKHNLDKCVKDLTDVISAMDFMDDSWFDGSEATEGFEQEAFGVFNRKPGNVQVMDRPSKSNRVEKVASVQNQATGNKQRPVPGQLNENNIRDMAKICENMKNLDISNKKQVGSLIMQLVQVCAKSRSEIEQSIAIIKKTTSCLADINTYIRKFNEDLRKCSPDEKEALDAVCSQFHDNMYRIVAWEEKVLHREGSNERIDNATDDKTIIKEALYLLSGFSEFLKDMLDSRKMDAMKKELTGGLNEAMSYLNSINFVERTNNTKSKMLRILNMTSKMMIYAEKSISSLSNEQKEILKYTTMIMRILMVF
ncbi:MAG: hypothetical protein IKA36_02845 [Clostridia bacterium]|nr:hypothetical protein [Clostridia bacterium]